MGNEDARKLALSMLRFQQYPKAQRHEVPSPYPIPLLDPSYRLLPTIIPHTSKTQLLPFSRLCTCAKC